MLGTQKISMTTWDRNKNDGRAGWRIRTVLQPLKIWHENGHKRSGMALFRLINKSVGVIHLIRYLFRLQC